MIFDLKYLLILILLFLISNSNAQVVINEIMTSPSSNPADLSLAPTTNANSFYNTNQTPSYNREWVELFNKNACDTVDISCYTLGSNMQDDDNGSSNWGTFTFPIGTKIPPHGYLVIGGNNSQVPTLEFNTTAYRTAYYGTQYIDGDSVRWFLRDANGWLALYNPQGNPIDAVFWSENGLASDLYSESEYAYPIITRTTCSGIDTLLQAEAIPGIKFIGTPDPSSGKTFQRIQDGSPIWNSYPQISTPHANNGNPIGPATFQAAIINESCGKHDGSILLSVNENGTGPYTISWNTTPITNGTFVNNLSAGNYIVTLIDFYGCFTIKDTFTIVNIPGPSVTISNIVDDTCTSMSGSAKANVIGGTPIFNYTWNTNPIQHSPFLQNVGAGIYTVTVTDSAGCIFSDSVTISDTPFPPFTIFSVPDTCSKGHGQASVQVVSSQIISYLWNTGNTTSFINNLNSGTYTLTMSDSMCTKNTSIVVSEIPGNQVDFSFNPPFAFIENPTINFLDLSALPISWNWNFGDTTFSNIQNPSHTYSNTGNYNILLVSEDIRGCVDTAMKMVTIKDKTHFFAPNSFTPNGDGINDEFRVYGLNLNNFKLMIFNRFGELIFETSNPEDGWNGTFNGEDCIIGVYAWKVMFDDEQGLNSTKKRTEYGKAVLIR